MRDRTSGIQKKSPAASTVGLFRRCGATTAHHVPIRSGNQSRYAASRRWQTLARARRIHGIDLIAGIGDIHAIQLHPILASNLGKMDLACVMATL
ncbi:MAG: hypothetical protein ACOH1R_03675 [Luteimonas sp.]